MATRRRELTVNSEDAALKLLREALDGKFENQDVQLVFDQWPIIEIRLSGKGYNSTITPDLAEALVELQGALNRSYARLVKETTDARKLTAEERQDIKFKAKVQSGSSLVKVDLGDYADKIATALAGKMDSNQILVAVLGIAVIAGGVIVTRAWLKHRADERKLHIDAESKKALSEQETRRLEIVAGAMAAQPRLEDARSDFDNARRSFVRSVGDAKTMSLNGVQMTHDEAEAIGSTPRGSSDEAQINGNFRIYRVDWQLGENDVRLLLGGSRKYGEFVASLSRDYIRPEHIEILKSAEWDRKKIYMSVNAKILRGNVTSARIVGVAWPDSDDD